MRYFDALESSDGTAATCPLPKEIKHQQRIVARIEAMAGRIAEAKRLREEAEAEGTALQSSELQNRVNALAKRYPIRQLSDLVVEAGYGTSVKCDTERAAGSIPVLRIPNVASERINFDDMKFGVIEGNRLSPVLVQLNDILVVRTNGSADLVGRTAVVSKINEPTAFASYLIRLRGDQALVDPHYFQLVLRHLRLNGDLFDLARTTAGQYNVSLGRLNAARVPVPPLSEQRRIVAQLDALQAKVEALRGLQTETAAELDTLLPAVLDRAFKGEL